MFKPETIPPHTLRKIELVNRYVEIWALKLLHYPNSKGIVYIDCMSNSGIYTDEYGNKIEGTALLVAKTLDKINYSLNKDVHLYFNDIDKSKIHNLEELIKSSDIHNVKIHFSTIDSSKFLRKFKFIYSGYNYLLFYDPYKGYIDWNAITPFLNTWGEVIINHMISGVIRGAKSLKDKYKIAKLEETYMCKRELLEKIGSDETTLRTLINNAIKKNTHSNYYIATFPFFISSNSHIYDLIFFTHNSNGFESFKNCAWKVFGGKSNNRQGFTVRNPQQCTLNLQEVECKEYTGTEKRALDIRDICDYIYYKYSGKGVIEKSTIKNDLKSHPIFPCSGFLTPTWKLLKSIYNVKINQSTIEL